MLNVVWRRIPAAAKTNKEFIAVIVEEQLGLKTGTWKRIEIKMCWLEHSLFIC